MTIFQDVDVDGVINARIYKVANETARITFVHGLGENRGSYEYLGNALAQQGIQLTVVEVPGMTSPHNLNVIDNALNANVRLNAAYNLAQTLGRDIPHFVGGQCAGSTHAAAAMGLTPTDKKLHKSLTTLPSNVTGLILLGPQVPELEGLFEHSYTTVTALRQLSVVATEDFAWLGDVNPYWAHETSGAASKSVTSLVGGYHHAFTGSDPWYPAPIRDPDHHDQIVEAIKEFVNATSETA